MKLKSVVRAIALLSVAAPALAQSSDASQRVEITGSSIKRIVSEGALPVQVISRKELERQGIVSAEQMIANLSVNGNGLDNLASNADVVSGAARGNNGATSANLRGQGANATLILVNGRRIAAHGLNGGVVDLNQVPFTAIDRVEILKDGASAIYGTDAIGGVINFILRKDFNGIQAQAFTDVTQQGGGNIHRVSVLAGAGDLESKGYNLMASLSYTENQVLRGDQRSFVNTFQPSRGLSVDTRGTPYATVFALSTLPTAISTNGTGPKLPGGTVSFNGINPLNLAGQPGCASIDGMAPYDAVLWNDQTTKYGCAWDTGRAAVIQQPVKNTNLISRGTFKLGEHQVVAEAMLGRAESTKSFSANQISSSGTATITLPNGTKVANPFLNLAYPSSGSSYTGVFNALVGTFPSIEVLRGNPLAFRWRCMPCGPREIDTTSDTSRLMLAADGPLPWFKGWDYRAGMSTASSQSGSTLGSGYTYQQGFANLINTGVLNPFLQAGQSQTAAAMSGLEAVSARGVKLYDGKFTVNEVDATISGPLFKLPAGDVMLAAGADVRVEKYSFNGDQRPEANTLAGVVFNAPFDNINALGGVSRNIKAVFAEAQIPLVAKRLELNLAARHDEYSGFGSTDNPKVSIRFTPLDQFLTRASYGTGFRVPTFNQLYNGVTESPYSGKDIVDPASCPTLKADASAACTYISPTILTGGKTTLGPETSKQWSAGFVYAPIQGFSAGADWWSINRNGTIQSPVLTTMLANYALFPGNFIRDAAGKIVQIDNRWVNAGETITKGVDVTVKGNGKLGLGNWAANLEGSYLLDKRSRLITSAAMGPSEVGKFTRSGDLGLRWKHTLNFAYNQGDWTGIVSQRFSSGYKDYMLPGVANGTIVPTNWNPEVASYTLYNLSVGYTGIKNLGLTAGIKNLFNTDPPFSAAYDGNTGAGSSWEPRVADPRGRSFTFMVDYKFF